MKIQRSIEIAASNEKVWPFLVKPEEITKWCSPAKEFEQVGDQNSGPGSCFYFEERAAGRLMKLYFVVTEWVVNERMAFKKIKGNFVKSYEQRYIIEKFPSGSRCTCFEEVTLPWGIFGEFILLFRRHYSEKLLDGMLSRLKILAEA